MVRNTLQMIAAGCGVLFVAGGALASPAGSAGGSADPLPMEKVALHMPAQQRDADLDAVLTLEAQRVLEAVELIDGQQRGGVAAVTADTETGLITVELPVMFLPESYGAAFEDQLDRFRTRIAFIAGKAMEVSEVRYLFDGRTIDEHFPEVVEEELEARAATVVRADEVGIAFVAASHGVYFHHGYRDWRVQRPSPQGVQEDFITPSYADELQRHLEDRASMRVVRPRVGSVGQHVDSGQEWWKLAARYHIKELYPEQTRIWNSKGDRIYSLRDYEEDMNSRPLLANHVGSKVAIHLHTNGDDLPGPRGVEVVAQPGRPDDARLATAVLCSMKEQIRNLSNYAEFPFASRPVFANKGENRLAKMPSVIVEVAYHSNPDDAAALQDPSFRTASMKGVEKGYRLFREGKTCEPFVLQQIPDIALAAGTSQEITLPFAGHPQFPVTMEFTTANCSSPGACRPSRTTFDDPNTPITVLMRCRGSLTGDARWSVVLRDVDGVATAPVEFQHTCSKPGGSPAA